VSPSDDLATARAACAEQRWASACDAYAAADSAESLGRSDLESYAVALFMRGNLDAYFAVREREYDACLAVGDERAAARSALWIGSQRMIRGEVGAGTGWLSRAARHVAHIATESAEAAFLMVAGTFELLGNGNVDAAIEQAAAAAAMARRDGDAGIATLALHQQGLICLGAGQSARGLALLDEAMLSVTSGELPPMIAGIVYCGVIEGCWIVYDLRRAGEWTGALSRWCDSQSQLVTFTGQCKVHRAQLLELRGSWADAAAELDQVPRDESDRAVAALAAYARGNLARLQGRWDAAGDEYDAAAELGYEPQPGLAQLRAALGSTEAAASMTRRALVELTDGGRRIELLAAAVEILLSVHDIDGAERAAAELDQAGRHHDTPVVSALAGMSRADVDLAAGRADSAVRAARAAFRTWLHLDAPYQQGRTRELIARACLALGDLESANRERAAARATYADLGALPDVARLDADAATHDHEILTPRELDVLRLIAAGATNKAVAEQLVLSERTVDRHVSNIFAKLGVPSRAAATAYAYQRHLL
jgi:ATP/maltotriose-dependent transcriptional regulator MalT